MNYTAEFFANRQPTAANSASAVVPWLIDALHPGSVVDVGCGTGTWLAKFRRHGVDDIIGIDGSWVPTAALEIPQQLFRVANLEQRISLGRRFDLAISLEVAEHLPPERADEFIAELTSLADIVLFSAAIITYVLLAVPA